MISPQPVRASEAGMRAKRSTSRRRRVVRRREYAARPVRRLMGANRRARLMGDAGEVLGGGAARYVGGDVGAGEGERVGESVEAGEGDGGGGVVLGLDGDGGTGEGDGEVLREG